jgi:hypothetical protein
LVADSDQAQVRLVVLAVRVVVAATTFLLGLLFLKVVVKGFVVAVHLVQGLAQLLVAVAVLAVREV